MFRLFSRFIFLTVAKFKIIGDFPNDIKKFRMIDQINNVYNSKYSLLSSKNQNEFITKIKNGFGI